MPWRRAARFYLRSYDAPQTAHELHMYIPARGTRLRGALTHSHGFLAQKPTQLSTGKMPAEEPGVAADESEPLRSPTSGDRVATRSGAWNAQDDKCVQSCVLAARLGGGSLVTVR